MDRTGKRRLLKLADMLEADAKNKKGMRFDLNVILAGDNGFGAPNRWEVADFKPEMSCNTYGCAMGLAAVSGAFKKAGLSNRLDKSESMIKTTWKGRIMNYDKAAMKLFGITMEQANYLFTPSYYQKKSPAGHLVCDHVQGAKGERRVAKRIRNLVAGKANLSNYFA